MNDLISRHDAIEVLLMAIDDDWEPDYAEERICELPSVDTVRHGKWVIEPDRTVMHCNFCGWAFEYYAGLEEEWNYCPHCGTDTRGEKV